MKDSQPNILRITPENIEAWLGPLRSLGNEFLDQIRSPFSERSIAEDQIILREMAATPQTVFFLALDSPDQAVGFCYGNIGYGYACGGKYIWINSIYVREEHRRSGHASALLQEIENLGQQIGSTLIICGRDSENRNSETFFASRGYHQEGNVVITKNTSSPIP